MKIFRKLLAAVMTGICICSLTACGANRNAAAEQLLIDKNIVLTIWYQDDALTPYLNQVAEEYHDANVLVTLKPVLVQDTDYIDQIYQASKEGTDVPDLFIMQENTMEEASLLGLPAENDTYAGIYSDTLYGKTAKEAASYQGDLYGYPLSFNTAFLLYNSTFGKNVSTFDDLNTEISQFQPTESNSSVKNLFTWDAKDAFLDYALLSSGIQIADSRDDSGKLLSLQETQLKAGLSFLAGSRAYYSVDTDAVSQTSCLEQFNQNALVYSIMDASALSKISSDVSYGICAIPSANGQAGLAQSTTSMVVVNSYSGQKEAAKNMAKAVTYDYADELQQLSGQVPARSDLDHGKENEAYRNLYQIYAGSVPTSQMVGGSSIYLALDTLITKVWNGTAVDTAYSEFAGSVTGLKRIGK